MNEFPIAFNDDEFDVNLGVYQKWLHGDKNQQCEKIYCMSAFQPWDPVSGFVTAKYQKYAEYLYLAVTAIHEQTSEWMVRIYIDESILNPANPDRKIWKKKFDLLLTLPRIQLICVKFPRYYLPANCHKELLAVLFRYLALFDPNVSICLFRDIDNVYTEQHNYFVNEWLKTEKDICFFMNSEYKRQQIKGLSPTGEIELEEKYYTTILSGLWNIRKPMGYAFPKSIWQKIFAFIEDYTDCTSRREYKDFKNYGVRFSYGFDEIALTRIAVPIFINMGLSIYTIPIKIYDVEFFKNMFENPVLIKCLRNISDKDTLEKIKDIMINKYWDMTSPTAGLAQYILCILANIYFGIITNQSKFYVNETLKNNIKNKVIPNTLLMSIGAFTFQNFNHYNWYPIAGRTICGSDVVKKFLATNKQISFDEWSAWGPPINPPPPDDECSNYGI